MNSFETSAVRLGALSDCMREGVPRRANHFWSSKPDVVIASFSSWLQGTASANLENWSMMPKIPVLSASEEQSFMWSYWTSSLKYPLWMFLMWKWTSPGLSRTCRQVRHWLTYCPTVRRIPGHVWRSCKRATTLLNTGDPWRRAHVLMLIQLGHDNHAGPFVQYCCEGGYFAQKTPFEFRKSSFFFCLK